MGVFYISGLNGFRWTKETITLDPNLNTLPQESELDPQSYAAPIQKTDIDFPALVCLSDYPDMTLEFLTCDNRHISYETLGATSSSITNQSFLQYLAVVNFSSFPMGICFARVSYDGNDPAIMNGKLVEQLSPYIDGDLRLSIDSVQKYIIVTSGTDTYTVTPSKAYMFTALSEMASSAANPRIRLTVTKTVDGVEQVIYDKSEVVTGTNSFSYSGIAQVGAVYNATVTTEDTAAVISPINIADNGTVVVNEVSWISCPIDVQDNHPNTQLFRYQNSENIESVLFHPSDLILHMRMEGSFIGGYQPKANREDFEDQPYNPVLLNGFNYDIYTHYLGAYEVQLPDWRIKQLNLIWAKCDQVQIDYDFYVAVGDFKFERPTYTRNRNGYNYELDLQIVKGYEFGQLTAGTTPTGDLIVVRKTWPAKAPFPDFTSSFAINGVFTAYSTIDYFETINPSLNTFILKVGTTVGGNEIYQGEIGTPNADTSIELIETHRPLTGFNAPTTIYVTIPDGISIKLIVVYDQLDSPPTSGNSNGGKLGRQGTACYYKELVAGYFTRDWDIATGLGKVGSDYEGCQIVDEAAGRVIVGWDRATVDPLKGRGTPGVTGAQQTGVSDNELTLTRSELPAEGLFTLTGEVNNTNGDIPTNTSGVARSSSNGAPLSYEMHRGTNGAQDRGLSEKMGSGLPINIGNDGLIYLFYIQL